MDTTRKNEIKAVLLFSLSLFLFLSLISFHEEDLSFYTNTPNVVSGNLTGVIGAYISGVMIFLAGRASFVIPILIMIWGFARLMQIEPKKMFFKFFGTVFLIIGVSSSISMIKFPSTTMAFSGGGLIGALSSEFLVRYLGMAGSVVFITAMVILSLLIATEFLIFPVVVAAVKLIMRFSKDAKIFIEGKANAALIERKNKKVALKDAKNNVAQKMEKVRQHVEESKSLVKKEPKIIEKVMGIKPVKTETSRVAEVSDILTGSVINYKLPALDLLKTAPVFREKEREELARSRANVLENTLADFGVSAKVVKINKGPVITMYELEPSVGTKVASITSLSDNISLSMKSANIRIVTPLPGKGTIGIEVPNEKSELVILKDILASAEFAGDMSPLKIALGKDLSGHPIVLNLSNMPHLLIAGATGSGKTVCINSIISCFLFNSSPAELKFLMVDPKRVELMMFEGIPHLISPIVTNPKKVAAALAWAISEMERRYDVFAEKGVRNITVYKEKAEEKWEKLPYIVIIIDELADLMVIAQQDIESSIMRLAQLSRAAGIHMILATQRPSVNVITGVIKANFPARISFKVASKVDSRTVLDANGAEKLLGRGDMLLMEPGNPNIVRGQCSFLDDAEIRNLVKYIKSQAGPQYSKEVMEKQERKAAGIALEKDELYAEAVRIIIETKQASVSMVQRKLRVGYSRAARLIDIMEEEGVVGPYNGSKPREILIESLEDLEKSKGSAA